jgi:hypothetical protein
LGCERRLIPEGSKKDGSMVATSGCEVEENGEEDRYVFIAGLHMLKTRDFNVLP